jgi:hypothetical protein
VIYFNYLQAVSISIRFFRAPSARAVLALIPPEIEYLYMDRNLTEHVHTPLRCEPWLEGINLA